MDRVSCYYGAAEVLKEVTISARRGEVFGIIGPNGSGKTTFFRCIAQLLRPKKGSLVMDEEDMARMGRKELARKVGTVAQDQIGSIGFTAMDVVVMGRIPHLGRFQRESGKDLEVVRQAMERTGTLGFADRPVNELSGGERQRVFIARALAQEPRLLLLDEPTSNLDISAQLEILNLIEGMSRQQGLTVLVALHDLNLAARYCRRIALLEKGRLVAMGTPDEVLTPANIRRAFGIDVMVRRHEVTDSLYITPVRSPGEAAPAGKKRVHLICGAGTGSRLMGALARGGYRVSAGVLNVLDSDHETARSLGVQLVEEAPFSPITDESHTKNQDLIDTADLVVLTSPPIGPGNLRNLEAARFSMEKGIPFVILKVEVDQGHEYVFEGGKGLMEDIKGKGAKEVAATREILEMLED